MRHAFVRPGLPRAVPLVLVLGAAAATAVAVPALASASTQASSLKSTVYVSAHGKAAAHDASCQSAAYASIGAGVSAVAPHGTVVVCGGTYREDVVVARPVSLAGGPGTGIDAAGKINGILIRAAGVKVSGFTVTSAIGEGILVNSANHVSIEGNVVTGNDLGGVPVNPVPNSYAECRAQPGIPGDCGEGVN